MPGQTAAHAGAGLAPGPDRCLGHRIPDVQGEVGEASGSPGDQARNGALPQMHAEQQSREHSYIGGHQQSCAVNRHQSARPSSGYESVSPLPLATARFSAGATGD